MRAMWLAIAAGIGVVSFGTAQARPIVPPVSQVLTVQYYEPGWREREEWRRRRFEEERRHEYWRREREYREGYAYGRPPPPPVPYYGYAPRR